MARTKNVVILIGRLGKDPEMRFTPSAKAITVFSLATDRHWKDASGEWQDETDWHNVECWGDLAERIASKAKKGMMAYVQGSVRYESWTTDDGAKRYKTKIVANDVTLLEKTENGQPQVEEDVEIDIPIA